MIKKAVIVAAGLSSRLYPLTSNLPKGLLKINDMAILERSVSFLRQNGIEDIALIIGYNHQLIRETLGETVTYIVNPFYNVCNNMGSLWFARDFVQGEPFIYLHGDLIYDEVILKNALQDQQNTTYDMSLVTDFGPADEEAMKVVVDEHSCLIQSNKLVPLEKSAGEWIGIACINHSKALFNEIESALLDGCLKEYDTYAFTNMARDGFRILCTSTLGLSWVEIDFLEDYQRAKVVFGDE